MFSSAGHLWGFPPEQLSFLSQVCCYHQRNGHRFPRTVWSASFRLLIFAETSSAFSSALRPCFSLQPNKYLMHGHRSVTATSFPEEEWMWVARVYVLPSTSVNRRIRICPSFIYAYSDAMPCSGSVQVEKNTLLGGNIRKIHKRAIFCHWRRYGCSRDANFSLFRAGYFRVFSVEKWGNCRLSNILALQFLLEWERRFRMLIHLQTLGICMTMSKLTAHEWLQWAYLYEFFFVFDLLMALLRTDGKAAFSLRPLFISLAVESQCWPVGFNILAGKCSESSLLSSVGKVSQQNKLFLFSMAFTYEEAKLNSHLRCAHYVFPER